MPLEAVYRFGWSLAVAEAHDLDALRRLLWYANERDRIRNEQRDS